MPRLNLQVEKRQVNERQVDSLRALLSSRRVVGMAIITLSPLAIYRFTERAIELGLGQPWQLRATHTLPPLAMLLLSIVLVRRAGLHPTATQRSSPSGQPRRDRAVALGMLVGGLAAAGNLLLMVASRHKIAGTATINLSSAAVVGHVLLLAPVAEEVTFRGLIHRLFRQRLAPLHAAPLSATIFALMHPRADAALWAFVLGIVAAVAFDQSRSLWTPMLIHAGFNAAPVALMILEQRSDDPCLVWLALAGVALCFTLAARSASHRSAAVAPAVAPAIPAAVRLAEPRLRR